MQFNKISIIDGYELQKVRFSVANHVGLITLHNPPVNALDGIVQEEILRLCAHLFRIKIFGFASCIQI